MMKTRILTTLLFVVVLAASGCFWFARNYHLTGNPVYPFQVMVGDKMIFEGKSAFYDSRTYPWHHIPDWLQTNLDERHWSTVMTGAFDPWPRMDEGNKVGGFGPVFGVLMVPAIPIALLLSARRKEDTAVLYLLLAVLVPFIAFPQHTWARFILPTVLAGFVSLGYVLKEWR